MSQNICDILCNATGTEKYPLFFIRKWKQPHCFGKRFAKSMGFHYCNNKTAWMTSSLFKE
ncbi:hypothetical protein WOLCODRAFT_79598 [Wolfiporia cocos MD-104 SS10]|uniref:DDE-1 domain-containing protein n=1 Tax=Wolfiporia cocos (strain MD-104) TaxID=742152 RepID=A0A2H3J046_WOLCO|nr:hypothetical protein WOLCODRAFT_79598 [Wolfiporia cocos MD-104 SS10]